MRSPSVLGNHPAAVVAGKKAVYKAHGIMRLSAKYASSTLVHDECTITIKKIGDQCKIICSYMSSFIAVAVGISGQALVFRAIVDTREALESMMDAEEPPTPLRAIFRLQQMKIDEDVVDTMVSILGYDMAVVPTKQLNLVRTPPIVFRKGVRLFIYSPLAGKLT